ncbi:YegS/Rv2252/BmrU family lipid kinase [Desulfohalotomaculum tongense]|uniref:diacylglycerol/lipid kinase family protein n=1 Tax=Desulforadius tongensis TaxID=1216062 RepID=UPI00195C7E47|nr:YegS/Rv2252/BmrU family lipid kinase [Desulforadius tongensis]MBM7855697.1 YegS/Rv2252/BmrU family lipid kinase [Desulforadius tongensis]
MKKALIIYNPTSGNHSFPHQIDQVTEACHSFGYLPTFYRIGPELDYDRVFNTIDQYQILFISGGDGSVSRAVNRLLRAEADLPVGIIPSGTANDFATALGLERQPGTAVRRLLAGDVVNVDIGRINDRYFVNVASAGVLTTISQEVNNAIKSRLGITGYYLKGLEHVWQASPISVTIEGEGFKIDGEIMLFLVLNSTTAGSIRNVAPHAAIADGKLDLVVLKKCSPAQLVPLLLRAYEGRGAHLQHPLVEYHQTRWVKVSSEQNIKTDIDGEPGPDLPLDIEVLPGRLKLMTPALK